MLRRLSQRMSGGLWRHGDFMRLWSGQSLSLFGSQVTFIALPLAAVLTLDATPVQMGVLTALLGLPSLIIGPFVGAYVDRHRRRSLLIVADWARVAVIGAVPAAYFLDLLTMELLYVVAFGMGVFGLVFEVSYRSYLPSLVGRRQLVEANSKLELGRSGADVAGPGVGGALIQAFGAPVALIADGVSYVISALLLHSIRAEESNPERPPDERSLFRDAWHGLKTVWSGRHLRPLLLAGATVAFFNSVYEAVYLLYISNELGMSAGLIGGIFASGSVGLVLGAIVAGYATRRFGVGPSIILAIGLIACSDLALPLATGPLPAIVVILIAGQFAFGIGLTLWNINQISLRQSATSERFQGRMNAAFRVAMAGSVPLGAIAGGFLGEYVGLRETLFIGVAGEASAVLWLVASPLMGLREMPEAAGA